jgi:hypothetical protein
LDLVSDMKAAAELLGVGAEEWRGWINKATQDHGRLSGKAGQFLDAPFTGPEGEEA